MRSSRLFTVRYAHWRVVRIAALALLVGLFASPLVVANAEPSVLDAFSTSRHLYRWRLEATGAVVTRLPAPELQRAPNDCALTVVERLYHTAGRAAPPRALLDTLFALGPRGVTLDHLATGLTRLGLPATVQRHGRTPAGLLPLDSAALRPPAIPLVQPGHYVLLTARTATHVEYFDPLIGLVRQPIDRFGERWTGKSVQLSTRDN